ncbi:MAG: hypothetical protein ACOVQG_03445 [Crocinitomicaceae bacterium]|jgi:hypothetical protein
MKNSKKLVYASLAGVAALTVSSCGKYEDGPKFSLLSKKTRVAGDWDVKSVGSEVLGADYGLTMTFDKDGSMKWTYTYGSYSESYVGSWDFSSDKENLVITVDGDIDTLEIKRLTNKEMWLDDDYTSVDGDIWKLEAK